MIYFPVLHLELYNFILFLVTYNDNLFCFLKMLLIVSFELRANCDQLMPMRTQLLYFFLTVFNMVCRLGMSESAGQHVSSLFPAIFFTWIVLECLH